MRFLIQNIRLGKSTARILIMKTNLCIDAFTTNRAAILQLYSLSDEGLFCLYHLSYQLSVFDISLKTQNRISDFPSCQC